MSDHAFLYHNSDDHQRVVLKVTVKKYLEESNSEFGSHGVSIDETAQVFEVDGDGNSIFVGKENRRINTEGSNQLNCVGRKHVLVDIMTSHLRSVLLDLTIFSFCIDLTHLHISAELVYQLKLV